MQTDGAFVDSDSHPTGNSQSLIQYFTDETLKSNLTSNLFHTCVFSKHTTYAYTVHTHIDHFRWHGPEELPVSLRQTFEQNTTNSIFITNLKC